MRKLSEILKLAMPAYIEFINDASAQSFNYYNHNAPVGNMCVRLASCRNAGTITFEEFIEGMIEITKKIKGNNYLYRYLASKGRKTSAAAQIQFYQKWIKQLEREGL